MWFRFTFMSVFLMLRLLMDGVGSVFVKSPSDERDVYHINGRAQGTTYSVTYYSLTETISKREIDSIFTEIDQSLSIYRENTLISSFNNSISGLEMDDHLRKVVKKSLEVSKKSDGIFDITIYPLVQLWGFGTVKKEFFPDSGAVEQKMKCVGFHKISIKGKRLTKSDSCVKINLNAIAPGYTSDVIAEFLEKRKVNTYVVEVGGELRIKGVKPDGNLLSIGIEAPATPGDEPGTSTLQRIVRIKKGAMTTAGNYRQYREQGNQKVSHLLDARTGYPIQNELISVTVLAKDAMTADAYDNVLMGMGLQQSFRFLKRIRGLDAYFIYKKPDGTLADTATAGFYKVLH